MVGIAILSYHYHCCCCCCYYCYYCYYRYYYHYHYHHHHHHHHHHHYYYYYHYYYHYYHHYYHCHYYHYHYHHHHGHHYHYYIIIIIITIIIIIIITIIIIIIIIVIVIIITLSLLLLLSLLLMVRFYFHSDSTLCFGHTFWWHPCIRKNQSSANWDRFTHTLYIRIQMWCKFNFVLVLFSINQLLQSFVHKRMTGILLKTRKSSLCCFMIKFITKRNMFYDTSLWNFFIMNISQSFSSSSVGKSFAKGWRLYIIHNMKYYSLVWSIEWYQQRGTETVLIIQLRLFTAGNRLTFHEHVNILRHENANQIYLCKNVSKCMTPCLTVSQYWFR